jgi:hypothetical protein
VGNNAGVVSQQPTAVPESVFAHAAPVENEASPASPLTIGIFVVIWLLLMLGAATTTVWFKERNRG